MRVVVVGAEGPLGRFITGALPDRSITHVVSLVGAPVAAAVPARGIGAASGRVPAVPPAPAAPTVPAGVEQHVVDLAGDLSRWFAHADAVVYAGWPVSAAAGRPGRPSGARRPVPPLAVLRGTCDGAARAEVRAVVAGTSGAVYRRDDGPVDGGGPVDEDGAVGSSGRPAPVAPVVEAVVEAERVLDEFETAHPAIRTVRLRAGWVVGSPEPVTAGWPAAARRLLGVAVRWKIGPDLGRRTVQPVHVADFADAVRRVLTGSVSGPFNVAADPVDAATLDRMLGYPRVRVAADRLLRAWSLAGRLGLPGADPERLRLALEAPELDTGRARRHLGWAPAHATADLLEEWLDAAAPGGRPDRRRGSRAPARPAGGAAPEPGENPSAPALVARYEAALAAFGDEVHAVRGDRWEATTAWDGWSVLELVTAAARDQYRVAFLLGGATPAAAEAAVPGDPLGFVRADGWDLAAERVSLAAAELVGAGGGGDGAVTPVRRLNDVLPGALHRLEGLRSALAEVAEGAG